MQERIDDANQTYEGDQPQMMDGLGAQANYAAASVINNDVWINYNAYIYTYA